MLLLCPFLRTLIAMVVMPKFFQHFVVVLQSVKQLFGLEKGMPMIAFLVIAELLKWVHHVQLYLFTDDLNFFPQFVEDVDDVLTEKNDVFLFFFIKFKSPEEGTAGICEFTRKTRKQADYAGCKFLDLVGAFFVGLEFVFEDGMKESPLPDQHFSHFIYSIQLLYEICQKAKDLQYDPLYPSIG
jgi:hypothetical protein